MAALPPVAALRRPHMEVEMATGAQWRVGDAEREAVAGQLREHYAAGRLSIDEFRARLDAAYAAATAAELRWVTADLPAVGPAAGPALAGPAPAGRYRAVSPRRRHHGGRAAAALILAGLVTAGALALGSLPHGGLLVLAFALVLVPVMLLAALAGAAIWIGRRAWRSGIWLEAVPVAVGMPWLARVVWMARAALVGRALWQAGGRASRAVRPRRSRRPHGRYRGHGYAQYQSSTGGPWHQARVGDLSGTTR